MTTTGAWYAIVLVVAWIAAGVSSDAFDHRYKAGDAVPFYARKVYPFGNPSETYHYYSLPFCFPVGMKYESKAFGEGLKFSRLVRSPYKLEFLVDKQSEVLCQKKLLKKEVADFRNAVSRDYLFQMHYDDLPIWGFLGRVEKNDSIDPKQYRYWLYKHLHFEIFYNKDRIIRISARTDPKDCVELTDDKDVLVDFLYTVKWNETDISFEKRMEKYYRSHFEILSVIGSCGTILLLTGFLVAILTQALKADLEKYAHDQETADDKEETGWKVIHGDVFRFPKNKSLLAAALGSGTQLVVLVTLVLLIALVGVSDIYNEETPFALGVMYAVTSFIAGYKTASFYSQLEGTYWVCNLLFTGFIFSGPLLLICSFLNSVVNSYKVTSVMPLDTTTDILQTWALAALPLSLLGWIAGKCSMADFEAPCPTSKYPRKIPPLPWYRQTLPQMAVAGFLPFCASYGELHHIFASLWGDRVYTSHSILFIVFISVLVVTAFVTVALTFFQLAAEDHDWWWRSFLYGGSSGFYVFGYCLYYYACSGMSSFMQNSVFFAYMAFVSYAVFVMLGAVGFYAALFFVQHIYGSIMKRD